MPHTENHKRGAFQKGYSIEDLIGPDFIERYQNRELGEETIDNILGGLEQNWNNLDEGTRQNIVGAANWVGDAYSRARSIDETEKYNPIAYAEAGALRTIEGVVNVIGGAADMTLGNLGRGAGWMMGLDPRAREALAVGSQLYLGPKAIKGISKIKPKHLGIKQSISKIAPLDDAVPYTKKLINITDESQLLNIIDDTFNYDIETFSKARQIYKHHPDAGWKTALTRAQQLKGITNQKLIKEFTSGSLMKGGLFDPNRDDTTRLQFTGSIDKDDIPTYKKAPLDLDKAIHPTTYDGINTINTLLNKHGGFKGARLNLKSYDLKGNYDKRVAATVYFTPYGKGGNFQAIAKREKSIVYQIFGTDLERMGFAPVTEKMKTSPSVQAHHKKTPIKAIVPGFNGIVKESPKYHRFTKLFFDNMLALGDMPENITGVLGHVARDPDSPHSLSHLFTRYMMGEDGKIFWTQDKLDQIVVYDNEGNAIGTKNDDLREEFMLDQIDLLKDNIKVLENATKQYEILFKQGIQDPATVIEYFEEQLPNLDKEYIRAFAPKILEKFIADVKAEEAATVLANPVTTSTRNEIIDNIFRRENVKRWRTWDVPVRKARMKEITDGWSFEQIEAFIDAGWLDDERLHELFNPPPESWETLFPDR